MKTILIALNLLMFSSYSIAQNGLLNMSFENWGVTLMGPAPNGWYGMNLSEQNSGAQQGNKYLRITTTATNSAFNGVLYLGSLSTTSTVIGAPYAQRPSSLSGFYKSSGLAIGDSIGVLCYLIRTGTLVSMSFTTFTSNVPNWISFSLPFFYFDSQVPDTAFIMAYSNPVIMGGGSNATGSIMDLDNLSFTLGTEVDEHSVGSPFLVFPNPAQNELNVISKDPNSQSILIRDVGGKLVYQQIILNEKTVLNLEKLLPGVYFYFILNDESKVLLSNKFVISK